MASTEYTTLMGQTFYNGFLGRHPGIKEALETGLVEGVPFRLLDGDIEPGDTYIAERNTGLKLLTCRSVDRDSSPMGGWVNPVEREYNYDLPECIKIELLFD